MGLEDTPEHKNEAINENPASQEIGGLIEDLNKLDPSVSMQKLTKIMNYALKNPGSVESSLRRIPYFAESAMEGKNPEEVGEIKKKTAEISEKLKQIM